MKSISNNKGYAMAYVVIVGVVISVILGVVYTIAFSTYNRTRRDVSSRQAYLNSKGVVQIVGTKIASHSEGYKDYVPTGIGDSNAIEISNLKISGKKIADKLIIKLTKYDIDNQKYEIVISATSTVGKETGKSQLKLISTDGDNTDLKEKTWDIGVYK